MLDEAGPSRLGGHTGYEAGMDDIVEGMEDFRPSINGIREGSCNAKRKTSSILRRRSQTSSSSEQDRLSIGSSHGDTLSITLSRRSSRVRFSDIETISPEAGPSRRISAELPARIEFPVPRLRPASLPIPTSPSPALISHNSDFMPRQLPTPQHSPVKSRSSASSLLRPRPSVEGLRADLESHRLSQNLSSRRSSRSSITSTSASSHRTSRRYSIFSDPDDLELLADLDTQSFTPQQLRYPSQSRPNSVALPNEQGIWDSGMSKPLGVSLPELPPRPMSLLLPPLPELPRPATELGKSPTTPLGQSGAAPRFSLSPREEEAAPRTQKTVASPSVETPQITTSRDQTPPVESRFLRLEDIASFPIPLSRVPSSSSVSRLSDSSSTPQGDETESPLVPTFSDTYDESGEVDMDEGMDCPEVSSAEETGDMADEEPYLLTSPSLGTSPALSELMERVRQARPEDAGSGDESEIDLRIPPIEAAIRSGVLSPHTRLLRQSRSPSTLNLSPAPGKRPTPTRSCSFNDVDGLYDSSNSDEEEWNRTLQSATIRRLAKSSYVHRERQRQRQSQSQKLHRSHSDTLGLSLSPMSIDPDLEMGFSSKRLSNISQSSSSSAELLTPNPRRGGFNLDLRSSKTGPRPRLECSTSIESGSAMGLGLGPIDGTPTKCHSTGGGRILPRPTRQVKGWGPPEILIDAESDNEAIGAGMVVLSSSDDEACLAPRMGGMRMSAHFNFKEANRRSSATSSRRTSTVSVNDRD